MMAVLLKPQKLLWPVLSSWLEPSSDTTATSNLYSHEIIRETKTINHKRAYSITTAPSGSTSAAVAVEIKSEFPQLTQTQIILIAIFSSVILLLLFCTIVYQIYKRNKAKKHQKIAEKEKQDEMVLSGQHHSTRPIIYNVCTDANSTAFLNPSVSTTFTISSSQSTSRFQEYFLI